MKKNVNNIVKLLVLPIIVYIMFLMIRFDRFSNLNTLRAILLQTIIPTIIAYSYSFSNTCGIFDFSLGSRMIISGIVGGILSQQFGFFGLIMGCFLANFIFAALNGVLNWVLKIPSLILTMGLTMIYEIIGKLLAGSYGFIGISSRIDFLGASVNMIIVMLFSALLFYLIENYTKFSFEMRAVGNNEIIAKNAGVKTNKVKFISFIYGSIFLSIAAVLTLSNSGSIGAQTGLTSATILFRPLISIIIATAMKDFADLTFGIFVSQFTLNIIFVGLIAIGMPDTIQDVVLGIFLLIVMIVNNQISKRDSVKNSQIALD